MLGKKWDKVVLELFIKHGIQVFRELLLSKNFFQLQMVTRSKGEKQVAVFSSKRESEYKRHLDRFWQEAKIMSMFTDSVNCINTYDIFEENGTAYIVMEYISAPDLKTYLRNRNWKPLQEPDAVNIISQVLSGLEEIHSKGVYHLDIAPDNMFILHTDESVQVKLIIYDFGAARRDKDAKKKLQDDDIIVKPGFAPPEQYKNNGRIGPWTDIYAVGANLYYLLTGVLPLEATDREQKDTMEKPAQLALVSPAVNNAVLRAMALNPELRYRNAKEFLADLKKEKVRSDEEELLHRKKARNRFMAVFSTVLAAAVAVVMYFGITKGKILEDNITVWVVSDTNIEMEQERYEAVVDLFQEFYPQIDVDVVAMTSADLDEKFLSADKNERPDLLETTYATDNVLEKCVSLSDLLAESKKEFVTGLSTELAEWNKKSVPLGLYVTVLYKQSGVELERLSEVSSAEFLSNAAGYLESDTTIYTMVQNSIAGRYEIKESSSKIVCLADVFSIYAKSINKSKAAKAFLEYLMTEAAQETLHLTYDSGYLPVSEAAFELYVRDVYSELSFLEDAIGVYKVEGR